MKIYTRKGDGGMTSLATGERVPKHDDRVDLYGTVDELNSAIGVAVAALEALAADAAWDADRGQLASDLRLQQSLLFELGAELAGYFRLPGISVIRDEDITLLEQAIDHMSKSLQPLKNFVLPGGTLTAAQLHVARTTCRRLEREMTLLQSKHPGTIQPAAMSYINRLSDHLFTAARFANHLSGTADISWSSRTKE